MSIKIGNNNKIENTTIINNGNDINKEKSFFERHSILTSIGCSIIASIIMMLGFWDNISKVLKNLF